MALEYLRSAPPAGQAPSAVEQQPREVRQTPARQVRTESQEPPRLRGLGGLHATKVLASRSAKCRLAQQYAEPLKD